MKKFFTLILCIISICSLTSGCQEEKTVSSKKIEAIKTNDTSIASIIRNPVTADKPSDTVNVAKIVFDEKVFDFGTVREGDIVKHTFKFSNTGKVPLLITDAKSTCGCTIPEWPKDPILPGESGQIKVKFNTKGKTEKQDKPVTVYSNAYPPKTIVRVTGFVKPGK